MGRQGVYDFDVIIFGLLNSCSFTFKNRKIHLIGLPLRPINKNKKRMKEYGFSKSPTEFEIRFKDKPIMSGLVGNCFSKNSKLTRGDIWILRMRLMKSLLSLL